MHVAPSPSASPIVLPPLAPGYAWSLTPQGWCPVLYAGPPLVPWPALPAAAAPTAHDTGAPLPAPALAPASSPPAPTTSPPAPTAAIPSTVAPASPPPAPSTADLLADVPPAMVALAQHDARVARALEDLAAARQAEAEACRSAFEEITRCGQLPRNRKQAIAWVGQLIRERPAVTAALLAHRDTTAASQEAARALLAAVLPYMPPTNEPHGPPPSAAAVPEPPERAPPGSDAAAQLDATQLDIAAQLQERDPAVARALAAHAEAMERAHATAATLAAALDQHGPCPSDPAARAAQLRALAARDPVFAATLAAALASVEATEHTAALLAEALAPHAARAPPEHTPNA